MALYCAAPELYRCANMADSTVLERSEKPSDEELAAGAPALENLNDEDFALPSEETGEAEPQLQDDPVEQPVETPVPTETAAQRTLRERFADRQVNLPGQTDDEVLDFI